jgi:hypothetical protein
MPEVSPVIHEELCCHYCCVRQPVRRDSEDVKYARSFSR